MSKVISKDGMEIAYETKGEGSPVILVDGALCYRGFGPMPRLSELLAPDFKVYVYDRRGRGESRDSVRRAADHIVDRETAPSCRSWPSPQPPWPERSPMPGSARWQGSRTT